MNEAYLGLDVAFDKDFLLVPTGDVQTAAARQCLAQDLILALSTPRGDLWCHPAYGMDIYKFLHNENIEINRLEFVQEIKRVIAADPRVQSGTVQAEIVSWDLHDIRFRASCVPITGGNPMNLVAGYNLKAVTVEVAT